MSSNNIRVLPVLIDGVSVNHRNDLKKYPLSKGKHHQKPTLFTVYQLYFREKEVRPFNEYVDSFCEYNEIDNPYVILPCNKASVQWRDIVDRLVSEDTIEAVVQNVAAIAMSDSRQAMKAAELLASWKGFSTKVEVDSNVKAEVDAKVNLNPELFDIPDGK